MIRVRRRLLEFEGEALGEVPEISTTRIVSQIRDAHIVPMSRRSPQRNAG